MFRKSCGKCPYTNTRRPSDITIADFWGWEKTDPTFNADDKGVSLVLLNTEKGRQLFEAVKERMNTKSAELENCLQPNLRYPTKPDSNQNIFEQDYQNKGFEFVYKKYGEEGWRFKFEKIQKKITDNLKKIIESIIGKQ